MSFMCIVFVIWTDKCTICVSKTKEECFHFWLHVSFSGLAWSRGLPRWPRPVRGSSCELCAQLWMTVVELQVATGITGELQRSVWESLFSPQLCRHEQGRVDPVSISVVSLKHNAVAFISHASIWAACVNSDVVKHVCHSYESISLYSMVWI